MSRTKKLMIQPCRPDQSDPISAPSAITKIGTLIARASSRANQSPRRTCTIDETIIAPMTMSGNARPPSLPLPLPPNFGYRNPVNTIASARSTVGNGDSLISRKKRRSAKLASASMRRSHHVVDDLPVRGIDHVSVP